VNRLLHIASVALITAGLIVLADVATTLAWREPVSSVYGSIQQHKAAGELADLEDSFPTRADLRRVARLKGSHQKVGVLADLFASRVHNGQAIGRIVIPDIDLDVIAVQGTDTASLEKGPGHYPETPFPGQGGTTAFAGHRTGPLPPP
jgi:sortase A